MSISSALTSATSGLSVSARLADTISSNVANALTEGYATRRTEVTSLSLGGYGAGARVGTTTRAENAFVTATRRTADAAVGATQVRSEAYDRMMTAMGEPGADSALSTLATGLETALMSATASPQSTATLAKAVEAASSLASALNRISEENVALRSEADARDRPAGRYRQRLPPRRRRHQPQDRGDGAAGPRHHQPPGRARPADRRHRLDRSGQDRRARQRRAGDLLAERRSPARRQGLRARLHAGRQRRHPRPDGRQRPFRAVAGPGRAERADGGAPRAPAAGSSTAARSARSSSCATGSCRSSTPRSTPMRPT